MNIDIIVVYIPRYQQGHEIHFVPPVTGIHLAALTPARHNVRVIHQQVVPVDLDTDADVIALSYFSGFAPEAYRLATAFRQRGKLVIAGGPHVTFAPEEALQFVDSVITGEAESVWETVLNDIENERLQLRYEGQALPLNNIPTARYDLLPDSFFIPRVLQATRGCPFTCSFCTVPTLNPGFRTRPVSDVVRDISYDNFKHWWQRKIVWFWDDNLTIKREYIKELLHAMIPLKRWWLTQASMDISKDKELLKLMQSSGCIGIFFGIESFGEESLKDARKRQNKVQEYSQRIQALHNKGICVMAGFIAGFDGDTPLTIKMMAQQLYECGVDVPFLSILTPYKGTAAYQKLLEEGRLRRGKGWEFNNGYNVAFVPKNMTPIELLEAHRSLWREAFSIRYTVKRIVRSIFYLRWGAFLMCLFMNVFYCLKRSRGNEPVSFEAQTNYEDIRQLIANERHIDNVPLQGRPEIETV
ncbi:MAG: radical SAM protein [Pyrinomonadaceae bacterium]